MSRFAKIDGVKYSAPTMTMITGAEVGRHHGARRRNQTSRDISSTFHLHRWMFARFEAGWRNSWQRGLERRGRCHHRPPQCDFLNSDALNKTKAVAETETAREGDGLHAWTTSASRLRKMEEDEIRKRKRWSYGPYVCLGLSTSGISANLTSTIKQLRALAFEHQVTLRGAV